MTTAVRSTSIQAERSVAKDKARLQTLVWNAIATHTRAGALFDSNFQPWTIGLTDEEICDFTGLAGSTERPRRGELVKQGRVRDSGLRRPTRSGRSAIAWVVAV